MKVVCVVAFVLALEGCTTPPPHGGGIPIHHEGVAARMRLACSLVATAPTTACTNGEMDPAERGFDEAEEWDASRDGATEAVLDTRDAAAAAMQELGDAAAEAN